MKRGHLEEFVQDNVCICVALDVDDDAHSFSVALVVDVADAFDAAVVDELSNIFDEFSLIDAVGYFGDDDGVVLCAGLDFGFCTHDHASSSGFVGTLDALHAHDVASGREVGCFDVMHQIFDCQFGVIDECDASVDDFSEVMGRHVCCHTDGDAAGTIDEEVGDAGRHDGRFVECVVEVAVHVHRFFVDVLHHGFTDCRETRFGVTHGGCRVAVHGAEVSLSVHEGVAHVPILRHANESTID